MSDGRRVWREGAHLIALGSDGSREMLPWDARDRLGSACGDGVRVTGVGRTASYYDLHRRRRFDGLHEDVLAHHAVLHVGARWLVRELEPNGPGTVFGRCSRFDPQTHEFTAAAGVARGEHVVAVAGSFALVRRGTGVPLRVDLRDGARTSLQFDGELDGRLQIVRWLSDQGSWMYAACDLERGIAGPPLRARGAWALVAPDTIAEVPRGKLAIDVVDVRTGRRRTFAPPR